MAGSIYGMSFSFEMKENLHEQTFDGMFKVTRGSVG
jgi:hypothetical protein